MDIYNEQKYHQEYTEIGLVKKTGNLQAESNAGQLNGDTLTLHYTH